MERIILKSYIKNYKKMFEDCGYNVEIVSSETMIVKNPQTMHAAQTLQRWLQLVLMRHRNWLKHLKVLFI